MKTLEQLQMHFEDLGLNPTAAQDMAAKNWMAADYMSAPTKTKAKPLYVRGLKPETIRILRIWAVESELSLAGLLDMLAAMKKQNEIGEGK